MKRLLAAVFVLTLALGACGGGTKTSGARTKPKVVTAFYPMQYVAGQVAGNKAEVSTLTPAGVEPHDLELTSGQVVEVRNADLLVYLGKSFQPAVSKLVPDVKGRTVDAIAVAGSTSQDPHVWLDPVFMVAIAKGVAKALGEVDQRNAAAYQQNAEELVAKLNTLDDEYQNGLSLCDRRDFVTSHEAFGHLASRFNLQQIGIAGLDPEQEPSAKRLAEVSALVKKRGITTIFFESLLPPDLAQTVSRETGARTAKLDPIESPPQNGDYLSAMRSNLSALRMALGCH